MQPATQPAATPAAGPGASVAIRVQRLRLRDFRNYRRLDLTVDARIVVLAGANGAGKTNLLEALSFLAPGRGLRQARLGDVARIDGSGGWSVQAQVVTNAGTVEIATGIDPLGQPGEATRRSVHIDGRAVAGPAALGDWVRAIWLSPRMDRLFADGAAARRRFLDRLVLGFEPGHARHLAAYERAMRQRLALLRDGGDAAWIGALEETMAEHAVAIAAARRDTVARLRGALSCATGPFPRAGIAVAGTLEEALEHDAAVDVEAAFVRALHAGRSHDREAGRTGTGPHRSDLEVSHLDKGVAARACSTGEQKALLIAVVLADARLQTAQTGWAPLLLLDEVAAHLDAVRRRALLEDIEALGAQCWLTGTDAALFGDLRGRARFLAVADATLTDRKTDFP